MARHLFVIQDDLFFAERARAQAARLGVSAQMVSPGEAADRTWDADSVVLVQITLNPERQLALIDRLRQQNPPPSVIAVSGHLETELRRRAKALGAVLAANSGMDRVLARALGLSDRDGDQAPLTP